MGMQPRSKKVQKEVVWCHYKRICHFFCSLLGLNKFVMFVIDLVMLN